MPRTASGGHDAWGRGGRSRAQHPAIAVSRTPSAGCCACDAASCALTKPGVSKCQSVPPAASVPPSLRSFRLHSAMVTLMGFVSVYVVLLHSVVADRVQGSVFAAKGARQWCPQRHPPRASDVRCFEQARGCGWDPHCVKPSKHDVQNGVRMRYFGSNYGVMMRLL